MLADPRLHQGPAARRRERERKEREREREREREKEKERERERRRERKREKDSLKGGGSFAGLLKVAFATQRKMKDA